LTLNYNDQELMEHHLLLVVYPMILVVICWPMPYIWVNYNDLTAISLESWLMMEIIPRWP